MVRMVQQKCPYIYIPLLIFFTSTMISDREEANHNPVSLLPLFVVTLPPCCVMGVSKYLSSVSKCAQFFLYEYRIAYTLTGPCQAEVSVTLLSVIPTRTKTTSQVEMLGQTSNQHHNLPI